MDRICRIQDKNMGDHCEMGHRLSVLKCLFLVLLPCDLMELKPNILVDVLIGMNTMLFSLFSFEKEETKEWPLVNTRFYLNNKSSFYVSIDFRYRWNFLGYSFMVTLGNSLDSLSN